MDFSNMEVTIDHIADAGAKLKAYATVTFDGMFKVHGVNMFPSQVEEILGMIDGVSSEYNINIAHDESNNRDIIMVTAEAEGRVDFEAAGQKIKELFKSKMSVTPKVTIVPVGTLPRTEKKAKRVIDHREE